MNKLYPAGRVRSLVLTAATSAIFFSVATTASAQDTGIADIQKNIDIFSGVLAEALDLEQATGLFGISLGGIDSTYLHAQGVVLEIRTPLSSRRNTLGLASLTATLQSMQSRNNPFEALSRSANAPADSPRVLALTATNEADSFYRAMMDRIASVDYSLRFNTAIQQAADYARTLRSLGNIDDAAYDSMRRDLESMREDMQAEIARLRALEDEMQQSGAVAANATNAAQADLQNMLDSVLAQLEPLQDRAMAKADELRERSRIAEQEYAERWKQEVATFESNLYTAMCNYGSTLHALPIEENVSVILTGLGEESGENRRTDRVHVFSKRDLVQCQNGDIDVATLQARSAHYSY